MFWQEKRPETTYPDRESIVEASVKSTLLAMLGVFGLMNLTGEIKYNRPVPDSGYRLTIQEQEGKPVAYITRTEEPRP